MTEVTASRVVAPRSHYISFDTQDRPRFSKEEVYFEVPDILRGRAVEVDVEANRYRYHGGELSDWRVIVRDVREPTVDRNRGASLTAGGASGEALRERAREAVRASLVAPEVQESRARAFYHGMRRMMHELRPYGDPATQDVRRVMGEYGTELRSNDYARLLAMADAYDAFARAYQEEDE